MFTYRAAGCQGKVGPDGPARILVRRPAQLEAEEGADVDHGKHDPLD